MKKKNLVRALINTTLIVLFFWIATSHHALAASPLTVYSYTISSGNPTATTATISWSANIAGTSSVSYGTTASYGSSSTTATVSASPSITLTGLSPSTTYHYEVFSYDAAGDTATSSDLTFTTAPQCNYYVDSVSGNDSNSGTSPTSPLRHLATVPVVGNGSTICLRRGSTFTDSLIIGLVGTTSAINNITVQDYGPTYLPMPLIDNSSAIPTSAWSLSPGTSHTYQATVTGPGLGLTTPYGVFSSNSAVWINVWECKNSPCTPTGAGGNDTFLSNQTSTSSVDATAGSYYIAGMTSSAPPTNPDSLTIYVHTGDGSSPASNGYTYTYSNRFTGVSIYGNNAIVKNIAVKKSSGNGGGFSFTGPDGSSPTFNNIEADQMGKHNLICTGGCTVNNSTFIDEYYPGSGNMFVAFDQNGSGLPITLTNDNFIDAVTTSGNSITAAFGHVGSGSSFSTFTVNGGSVQGLNNTNLGGVQMTTNKTIVNGLTCFSAVGCITGVGTTTITNVQDYSTISGSAVGLLNTSSTNVPITIASSSACDFPSYNHSMITTASGDTVTVASTTLYVLGNTGGVSGVSFGGAGSSLSMSNTTIDALPSTFDTWVSDSSATSSAPYTGDFNIFAPNMWQGGINGTAYHPLSVWQAATGQDAHSSTSGNGLSACQIPTITFTGPASGNINSASSNFTVTPSKAFTGTVVISLTGSGSAGLASSTVLTFNNSSLAQTFTLTPQATGTITLTPFVNGATTSPTFVLATTTSATVPAYIGSTTLTYISNIIIPGAPYGTPTATAGNANATVSFSAPASIGGSGITLYTITSSPGNISAVTNTTSGTVTGLTNGTSYTFTVTATNAAGTGPASAASNPVTPTAPASPAPTPFTTSSGSSGSVSASSLAGILAPGAATDRYLASLGYSKNDNRLVLSQIDTNPNIPTVVLFTRTLKVRDVNSDVKKLQEYLNTHGYTIAISGPGSPGRETNVFGELTRQSVMKFQKAHSLPATGFFGPMTIAAIKKAQ